MKVQKQFRSYPYGKWYRTVTVEHFSAQESFSNAFRCNFFVHLFGILGACDSQYSTWRALSVYEIRRESLKQPLGFNFDIKVEFAERIPRRQLGGLSSNSPDALEEPSEAVPRNMVCMWFILSFRRETVLCSNCSMWSPWFHWKSPILLEKFLKICFLDLDNSYCAISYSRKNQTQTRQTRTA